jgi:hypothetical protein
MDKKNLSSAKIRQNSRSPNVEHPFLECDTVNCPTVNYMPNFSAVLEFQNSHGLSTLL